MSQNALALPLTGVYSGTAAAIDINNAIDSILTLQSGASAPATPQLGYWWLDTSVAGQGTLKMYDGAQWVVVAVIDTATHRWSPPIGGGVNTLADAAVPDLGSVVQAAVTLNGTTAITGFGSTMAVGTMKAITFAGIRTLTHNATSLILPTGANITTAVGDTMFVLCISSGNYRVLAYQSATGAPLLYSGNVTGSFQLSGVLSPGSIGSSPQDDYAPTSNTINTIWRLTSSVDANITGIGGGASGRLLVLVNANAFGGKVLTFPIEATTSTAANRFTGNVPVVLRPGESRLFEYDSTTARWRAVNNVQAGGAWASFKNLKIVNSGGTPNSILNITADELVLEDTDGNTVRLTNVSQSPNSGTSGAGGMDTGAIGNSTFYSLWIIYNAITGVTSSLLSASATAPTMPSGYTFKMRVGWQRTDGSANFLRILQYGRRAQYVITTATNTAAMPNIANGSQGTYSASAPTWATPSVSSVVPSTATEIFVAINNGYNNNASTNMQAAPNNNYSGRQSTTGNFPHHDNLAAGASNLIAAVVTPMVLEATTIAVTCSGTGGGFSCSGWNDNI